MKENYWLLMLSNDVFWKKLDYYLNFYLKNYITNSLGNDKDAEILDNMITNIVSFFRMDSFTNEVRLNLSVDEKDILVEELFSNNEVLYELFLKYLPRYFFCKRDDKVILLNHKINYEKYQGDIVSRVVINFVNYLAKIKVNNRKITMQELYNEFSQQEHQREMKELKEFLQLVGHYYEEFENCENYDSLFDFIIWQTSCPLGYDVNIDAMAYAYVKAKENGVKIISSSYDDEIKKRIKEMRKI